MIPSPGVLLFERLQAAPFYVDLHRDAVALAGPPTADATWIDVGGGPGLVGRLAARAGYRHVRITDASAGMVAAARRAAVGEGLQVELRQATLAEVAALFPPADVVSAASLLAVLDDPAAGLKTLWASVASGGRLLIVEPTPTMTPDGVHEIAGSLPDWESRTLLKTWARARSGRSVAAVVDAFRGQDELGRTRLPLLGGAVAAWCLERAAANDRQRHGAGAGGPRP